MLLYIQCTDLETYWIESGYLKKNDDLVIFVCFRNVAEESEVLLFCLNYNQLWSWNAEMYLFNAFRGHTEVWFAKLLYLTNMNARAIDQRQTSNMSRSLIGNIFVDHSDVVEASPVGAGPNISSFAI